MTDTWNEEQIRAMFEDADNTHLPVDVVMHNLKKPKVEFAEGEVACANRYQGDHDQYFKHTGDNGDNSGIRKTTLTEKGPEVRALRDALAMARQDLIDYASDALPVGPRHRAEDALSAFDEAISGE